MAQYNLKEQDYRVALKAAMVINAVTDALDAMTGVAARWLDRGLTEEAANLLFYVTHHPDVRHDTFDYADERWLELEATICPRVIEDARAFNLGKTLNTVATYITTIDLTT